MDDLLYMRFGRNSVHSAKSLIKWFSSRSFGNHNSRLLNEIKVFRMFSTIMLAEIQTIKSHILWLETFLFAVIYNILIKMLTSKWQYDSDLIFRWGYHKTDSCRYVYIMQNNLVYEKVLISSNISYCVCICS